jgi:hypothetical protein
MVVKTYRGLLADGAQDKIPLSTRDGSVGYRIVKLQIVTSEPGEDQHESTVKIYKKEQTTINNTVDFTDNDLLGVSIWQSGNATGGQDAIWVPLATIFDQEIFNQDIYVTHSETDGSNPMNYYLELEQIKLDHTQNMSATLKAIRNSAVD